MAYEVSAASRAEVLAAEREQKERQKARIEEQAAESAESAEIFVNPVYDAAVDEAFNE